MCDIEVEQWWTSVNRSHSVSQDCILLNIISCCVRNPELRKRWKHKVCSAHIRQSSPQIPLHGCIQLTGVRSICFCTIMLRRGVSEQSISPPISVRPSREMIVVLREPTSSSLATSKGNTGYMADPFPRGWKDKTACESRWKN